MRILHITTNYPTEAHPSFGIFVKEQIYSLEKIGAENEVFFINGRERGKIEYLKAIFKLKKKLKKDKYDVIHCHHALSAITLLLGVKKIEPKIVVSYQNDPRFELGLRVFRYIKKRTHVRIYKNSSIKIDDDNLFILPNGVDIDLFKPIDREFACKKVNLNPEKKYLLFVSSSFIRKQKRIDRFEKVYKILKNKYANIEKLIMVNTDRWKVPYYYNIADVHLVTSDFEGSPNSVKECLACNTNVVATDVGNIKELINGVNGCFISDTDPENLVKLVETAFNTKCDNGRDKIKELKLDMKSVANELINVYSQVIQTH